MALRKFNIILSQRLIKIRTTAQLLSRWPRNVAQFEWGISL